LSRKSLAEHIPTKIVYLVSTVHATKQTLQLPTYN